VVTRNTTRLVAKGYSQVEGLDFGETYAPVARLESIRILLAYATHHGLKLYQMDVKSASSMDQSRKRSMWSNLPALKIVSTLTMFINSQRRFMGLSKPQEHGMNACEIFLSLMASKSIDIIFGSTNKSTCEEFSRIMIQKFKMSMMGELKYFLGFQVKQLQEGTFISQTKYIQDILNKFGMKDAKTIKTPMGTNGHLDLDTGGKSVDQKVYRSMI
jgi:hypothetical protein